MHSIGLTIRKTFQGFLDVDLFIENNTFVLFLWRHWCVLWCCQICSHHIWNFIDGLTQVFFSMLNKSMLKTRIFFYTLNSNLEIYTEAQCWWRLRQIAKFGENIFKANNIRQTISAAQGPWGISEQKCNMNICCKSFIKKVSKEP